VGGLVVSHGGPSCHAAVVARELGIPTIVGYADATTRITDGSTITVDPDRVTVGTS
jgi:pyruvate,water dikinase